VVTADNGRGAVPDVEYSATFVDLSRFGLPAVRYDHTAAKVPVYARGRNAVLFGDNPVYGAEELDNTELFDRCQLPRSAFGPQ